MKIVSWNCNWKNKQDEGTKIKIIEENFPNADIFVIQECKKESIDALNSKWMSKDFYNDGLDGCYGIAVLSKTCKIERASEFDKKFRHVVPYEIKKEGEKSLILFAVWTKSDKQGEFYYDKNVTEAVQYSGYQNLLKGDVIFIGDFNTGYNEIYPERYENLSDNLKKKGLIKCPQKNPDVFKMTYFHSNGRMYLSDFCFISDKFSGKNVELITHDDWRSKEETHYWHGSDHCPISVEFEF